MGICIYRHGDFRSLASPMCPPLPILLEYWLPGLRGHSEPGTAGWEGDRPALTRQARLLTATTVGIPLVLLVYTWLARRRGPTVGALAGGMLALSPTFLAAASVATTDACFALFGVLALAALRHHVARRSRWSYLLVGVAVGLAVGAKQSGVILGVVAFAELVREGWSGRRPGGTAVDRVGRFAGWVGARLLGLVATAFLTESALYGFRLAKFGAPGTSITIPVILPMIAALFPDSAAIMDVVRQYGAPLALDTFVGQMNHAAEGHNAFLMGMHSNRGWWYFFPVALALKSTPAELALMTLALVLAGRPATWRDPTRRLWLGTGCLMLAAGMASSINIGQRYMLLIYPLVICLGADRLGAWSPRHRARALIAGGLLLAGQATSAVGIAPHYLAYFNSFCGGPNEGYRYLVDSSLDWGQDLPGLRLELEARHYAQVALCYFGTAHAATYGLRTVDWKTQDDAEAAATDYLAISATSLQGAYGSSAELYERFKGIRPIRVGYSIFVYDLKDPRARAEWDAIRTRQPGLVSPSGTGER